MTTRSSAVRALLMGAVAAVSFTAAQAVAQDAQPRTTVINIDQVLLGQGIIEIDLNRDDVTDFLVEIVNIAVEPQVTALAVASDFPEARFSLPETGPDQFVTEVALVRAVDSETQFGQVLSFFGEERGTPFVSVFERGDTIGGEGTKFFSDGTALLYVDTVVVGFDGPDSDAFVDGPSFGPFGEDGANGFVGLSIFNSDETQNFGFLEITRGSVSVGQQGFQSTSGFGAEIGVAAVPVPAPLALLGFAIAGLFGLRRFKA